MFGVVFHAARAAPLRRVTQTSGKCRVALTRTALSSSRFFAATKMTVTDDEYMSDAFEPNNESDGSDFEPEQPPTKKIKKTEPAPKKTTKKVMTDFFQKPSPSPSVPDSREMDEDPPQTNGHSGTSTSSTVRNEKRTVEQIYQKKSQLEHILLRPDTYIGSVEAEEEEMWVYDTEEDMVKKRKIKYVPGLYKIVDEILVNAADNKIRDPSMSHIRVFIDRTQNFISIENNGKGIPVEIHKGEKVYVPEMIFGHLLTSSNYDDEEKKVTGGRNGYGAKLCNIYSNEFIVETADNTEKLIYKQIFKNNMSVILPPKITKSKSNNVKEFTRISFKPDLSKFGMTELDDDFEALLKKRAYDLAGCVEGISVFLNGTKIPVKGFQKYADLYTKSMEFRNKEGQSPIIFDNEGSNDRWRVGFAVSDGQFNQISFVNSICTAKGGTHVNYVADQIVRAITPTVLKKCGNAKPAQIKNHMCIFVNCLIENPRFDSQTKENMTLRAGLFGSTYKAGANFIKKVEKSGLIDNIANFVKFKEEQKMTRADSGKMSRRLNIPKLDDANLAGVRPHNRKCTLILTEGDSAKALVLSGLSVVGRDKFGVFPLRGKLLNVRDVSNSAIMSNAEITNIKAILGLQHGKSYTSVEDLRYGRLMIMTDQDHDGSHIKGLLINFLDKMFPSLLDIPGFLVEFITPIIKCKHKRTKQEVSFFTIPEYMRWAEENNQNHAWEPKYFKGLGTSDRKDARQYFSHFEEHMKEFMAADQEDRELIDMAFSKTKIKIDARKDWLLQYEPGIYIDHSVSKIKISDFVNKELLLFSMADNIRSIPSIVDGFKPSQRKVLYGAIRRGKNTEIKVAQFGNYVAGITQYHHGEQSVAATIIGMAQDYVGSNNINLLRPAGQFGTRHEGGKAAASPRYLFTNLSKIARKVFHPDDDHILEYLIEENKSIEPEWYIPILPMVLVNGAEGIGTGWSTSIPNYNPKDIVANLIRLMNNEDIVPMQPWFRGFKGDIIPSGDGKYAVNGIVDITDASAIKVTELPVRMWTEKFKESLDGWMDASKEKKSDFNILSYSNNSTDCAVEFTIDVDEKNLQKVEDMGLLKALKLSSAINTTNIVCFDKNGKLKRYNAPEEILKEFYDLRLEYYSKRKAYLEKVLRDEYEELDHKARFIELVINKKIDYVNRKEEEVIEAMRSNNLKRIFPQKANVLLTEDDDNEGAEGGASKSKSGSSADSRSGYEYLFSINVRGFTQQKVQSLREQKGKKATELKKIESTTPKAFWRSDLDAFLEHWDEILAEDATLAREAKPIAPTKAVKRKRTVKPKPKPKPEPTDENSLDAD